MSDSDEEAIVKKLTVLLILALAGATAAFACEIRFSLIGEDGKERVVEPGETVVLQQGSVYRLVLQYYEDHRSCQVRPEDTLFFLDGSRWRVGRDTAPLILNAPIVWVSPASRTQRTEIEFVANLRGSTILEIVRECPKGGFKGAITFTVG